MAWSSSSLSLLIRLGWHHTDRDDEQNSDGRPLGQAPSRSPRPTGRCRVGVLTRPTDRYQDSPKTSAGKVGVRPGRTPTHTLTQHHRAINELLNPRCRVRDTVRIEDRHLIRDGRVAVAQSAVAAADQSPGPKSETSSISTMSSSMARPATCATRALTGLGPRPTRASSS